MHKMPDYDRLREVCEGYGLLTARELVALIPEIVRDESIQSMIASAIAVKRLEAEEEADDPGPAVVIPLRRGPRT